MSEGVLGPGVREGRKVGQISVAVSLSLSFQLYHIFLSPIPLFLPWPLPLFLPRPLPLLLLQLLPLPLTWSIPTVIQQEKKVVYS